MTKQVESKSESKVHEHSSVKIQNNGFAFDDKRSGAIAQLQIMKQAASSASNSNNLPNNNNPMTENALQFKTMMHASESAKAAVQLQAMADNSWHTKHAIQMQSLAFKSSTMKQQAQFPGMQSIQKQFAFSSEAKKINEQPIQKIESVSQSVQKKSESKQAVNSSVASQTNQTGLPDNLKSGVENLSGISIDNVKVHYNSAKPMQLSAFAYTQGTDIHVAPGQERHLPHEAWHVVQQAQGRVAPTMQMKGVAVNDDSGLEREATVMGERARNMPLAAISPVVSRYSNTNTVQMVPFNGPQFNFPALSNTPFVKGFVTGAVKAKTNCGTQNSITTAGETLAPNGAKSQPGTPDKMKDYNFNNKKGWWSRNGGLVKDKTLNHASTQMHLINHRLRDENNITQNTPNNIFLGTQQSNNPTHLNAVETPVINAVTNHGTKKNAAYEAAMGKAVACQDILGKNVAYWTYANTPDNNAIPNKDLTNVCLDAPNNKVYDVVNLGKGVATGIAPVALAGVNAANAGAKADAAVGGGAGVGNAAGEAAAVETATLVLTAAGVATAVAAGQAAGAGAVAGGGNPVLNAANAILGAAPAAAKVVALSAATIAATAAMSGINSAAAVVSAVGGAKAAAAAAATVAALAGQSEAQAAHKGENAANVAGAMLGQQAGEEAAAKVTADIQAQTAAAKANAAGAILGMIPAPKLVPATTGVALAYGTGIANYAKIAGIPHHLWLKYQVTANYTGVPPHITPGLGSNVDVETNWANNLAAPNKAAFLAKIATFTADFAPNAFPKDFTCDVDYYYATYDPNPANIYAKESENHTIDADL